MTTIARVLALTVVSGLWLGSLALTGCPGPTGPTELDGGEDGLLTGYGTCAPAQLTYGSCSIGAGFVCSTWEHDHCGVCLSVNGEGRWIALGPHAADCSALATCPMVGQRRQISSWNAPTLCCTCQSSGADLRWSCVPDTSCVQDLGTGD